VCDLWIFLQVVRQLRKLPWALEPRQPEHEQSEFTHRGSLVAAGHLEPELTPKRMFAAQVVRQLRKLPWALEPRLCEWFVDGAVSCAEVRTDYA